MIPVARLPEPQGFDATTRKRGKAWLLANPTGRPRDYWSRHRPALAAGFADLCGYAAMLDPTGGTVDHYLSCENHRHLAYEWSNYRFASQVMNGAKRAADDAVLDPHEVGAGWFEILLPSLQMQLTERVPARLRGKAETTLTRLKLRDGERIVRWRRHWYAMYQSGGMTLEQLRRVAPLIADAVVRSGSERAAAVSKVAEKPSPRARKKTARKRQPSASRSTGKSARDNGQTKKAKTSKR